MTTYGSHKEQLELAAEPQAFLSRRARLALGVLCVASLAVAAVTFGTTGVAPTGVATEVHTEIAVNDGSAWTLIVANGLARDVNNYHTVTRLYQGNAAGATLAACQAACVANTACHMISFKTGDCRLAGTYSPSKTEAAPVRAAGFNCYIKGVITATCDDTLYSANAHPNIYVSSTGCSGVAAGERNCCKNGMSDRGQCATYCHNLAGCTGFWYYNPGGRCCPKDSWSDARGNRAARGGSFYSMSCSFPDCPAGQYRDAGAACTNCAAGSFWGSAGQQQSCTTCAAGTSSAAGASACTDCAVGKFSGVDGAAACTDCAAGKFAADTAGTACTDCAAGKISAAAAATTCTKCALGTTSDAGDAACANCAAGRFNTRAALVSADAHPLVYVSSTGCSGVAAGEQNCCKNGMSDLAACSTYCNTLAGCTGFWYYNNDRCCPKDSWVDGADRAYAGGSFYAVSDTCDACPAGTSSAAAAASCTDCAAGKYGQGESNAACTDCAAGTSAAGTGNFACADCAAGSFSAAAAAACTDCAAGKNAPNAGTAVCADCAAGTSSAAGADACANCAVGQTSTAGAACAACASGTFTEVAGDAPCDSCALHIPDVAPTVSGYLGAHSVISTWAVGDRAWSDRTYPWASFGDYTPANYQYKVKTSVNKRGDGMVVSLAAGASPRCFEVTVVSETAASNTSASLNPGPPVVGSTWTTGCAASFPTYTAIGNTYVYNWCRKTTICAGESAEIHDAANKSRNYAGDGKYEVFFKAVDPATCA